MKHVHVITNTHIRFSHETHTQTINISTQDLDMIEYLMYKDFVKILFWIIFIFSFQSCRLGNAYMPRDALVS